MWKFTQLLNLNLRILLTHFWIFKLEIDPNLVS